jgi:hypothetical protein
MMDQTRLSLRGVNDLINAYSTDLLPLLDIHSSNDEDDKSRNDSDQEMKDMSIGEVDVNDRDSIEIQRVIDIDVIVYFI